MSLILRTISSWSTLENIDFVIGDDDINESVSIWIQAYLSKHVCAGLEQSVEVEAQLVSCPQFS